MAEEPAAAVRPEPAEDAVLRRVGDGVAWITLNRPDAGNAITLAMREQIIAWLEEASADLAVRAVVLTGAGERGFCTGADLRSSGPAAARPEGAPDRAVGDNARMIRTGWQRLVSAVLDCEKPVIAAVNATAAGGGMHLALACDLVPHGRGDGVAGLRPVEGDPGHPVLDPPQHGVIRSAGGGGCGRRRRGCGVGARRRVGGHQTRWMMFIRDVHTGSPVALSLQAVSTTTNVMVLPFDSFW